MALTSFTSFTGITILLTVIFDVIYQLTSSSQGYYSGLKNYWELLENLVKVKIPYKKSTKTFYILPDSRTSLIRSTRQNSICCKMSDSCHHHRHHYHFHHHHHHHHHYHHHHSRDNEDKNKRHRNRNHVTNICQYSNEKSCRHHQQRTTTILLME
uniref:Uncharacterized protein n=1 Tax=Glossina pallidipes TaxID=7398 RepID=A0A1A9ZBM4_GLOPL